MKDKQQSLAMLTEEFSRWEELLANLSEEQITARQLPANLSIKDVIAHLRAWQQISIARLEAAQRDTEPELPAWLAGLDPESEDNLETINARIHATYRDEPWTQVHRDWRAGFQRFLELGQAIPEADLLDVNRYRWLEGQPLILVLHGSYGHHHHEHFEPLMAWLGQQGNVQTAE